MNSVKIIYLVESNVDFKNRTERLIKNIWGTTTVKLFNSCIEAYNFMENQQQFSNKEYPDLVFLGEGSSEKCINNFLNYCSNSSNKTLIYLLLNPLNPLTDTVLNQKEKITGILEKPICSEEICEIVRNTDLVSSPYLAKKPENFESIMF